MWLKLWAHGRDPEWPVSAVRQFRGGFGKRRILLGSKLTKAVFYFLTTYQLF
jgi:hypothetical protein